MIRTKSIEIMSNRTIKWPGASGKEYTYYIHERGTEFNPNQPANYVYAKETKPGYWTPVYIGETGDLHDRHSAHEKKPCIDANGATHIHVHLSSSDESVHRAEETDLRAKWPTPCNQQPTPKTAPPTTRQVRPSTPPVQNPWLKP